MRMLFVGDVVGRPGRRAITSLLPGLRRELRPDLVVVNGENAAGGFGITMSSADELFSAGADVLTLGNHTWDNKEIYEVLAENSNIVRPANYPPGVPGAGYTIVAGPGGARIAVINLAGRVFLDHVDDPFRSFDDLYHEVSSQATSVIVDFHAEATSEKVAFGWYADGRATAVLGTHTHVTTADERVLPKGTAYITDVGMCGPLDSVLGVDADIIVRRFLTQLPARFEVAKGPVQLNAVVVDFCHEDGRALAIERVRRVVDE